MNSATLKHTPAEPRLKPGQAFELALDGVTGWIRLCLECGNAFGPVYEKERILETFHCEACKQSFINSLVARLVPGAVTTEKQPEKRRRGKA